MTGFRRLAICALGLILVAGPAMASFNIQEARKTCSARYDREKDGGTLPAGMPKSKYMSQCVNGLRRDEELEKSLATGGGGTAPAAGSNELTISTAPTRTPAKSTTQAKPAGVSAPTLTGAKGKP